MSKTNHEYRFDLISSLLANSGPAPRADFLPVSPFGCNPLASVPPIVFSKEPAMSIEQIIADNTAAMRELITVLKAQANQPLESDTIEPSTPSVPEDVTVDPPVDVAIPTEDEMKDFVRRIINEKGAATVINVFNTFGKERLSDFDSSQYVELKQRLEA